MIKYSEFKPTSYDCHIPLDDREDWLVLGVSQNRDSCALEQSNFAVALEILGGESDTIEVHRFDHWRPGWFELILADPSREKDLEGIESRLEDYNCLDEEDLSFRENEEEEEAWESFGASKCLQLLVAEFGLHDSTEIWLTEERLWTIYHRFSSGTEHTNEGPRFNFSWINRLSREKLAAWIRKERNENYSN